MVKHPLITTHDNVLVLILLNQWLTLTMLRATQPSWLSLKQGTGNRGIGEWEWEWQWEWGTGNGESLKRGIFESGNLSNAESLKAGIFKMAKL